MPPRACLVDCSQTHHGGGASGLLVDPVHLVPQEPEKLQLAWVSATILHARAGRALEFPDKWDSQSWSPAIRGLDRELKILILDLDSLKPYGAFNRAMEARKFKRLPTTETEDPLFLWRFLEKHQAEALLSRSQGLAAQSCCSFRSF